MTPTAIAYEPFSTVNPGRSLAKSRDLPAVDWIATPARAASQPVRDDIFSYAIALTLYKRRLTFGVRIGTNTPSMIPML
jgi:hypothetical protein